MHPSKPAFGFWVHELPAIREIRVPPSSDLWLHNYFVQTFSSAMHTGMFQTKTLITDRPCHGTGDPFVIIDGSVIAELPPYLSLIEPWLDGK